MGERSDLFACRVRKGDSGEGVSFFSPHLPRGPEFFGSARSLTEGGGGWKPGPFVIGVNRARRGKRTLPVVEYSSRKENKK